MKAIEAVQDLIEEVKIRTIYWAFLIFGTSYFFTHTSNSLWMNIPISILLVSALRIFCNKVELRWRIQRIRSPTYLSHLERKQLSINEARLSSVPPPGKWKRKIGSPVVEAAMNEFINKLLQDFIVDLWYSDITTNMEAPELMRELIMDVLGEISGRVKELNLVDLLTRDVVDVIGDHLDLYRRNQLAIGRDVMSMLTTEERDERLKHHLMDSRQLHPALVSSDLEYKVLRCLANGLLSVVLRAREAHCSLVRCIARELVTSLVLQPIMSFACPMYINELIECLLISIKNDEIKVSGDTQSVNMTNQCSTPGGGVDNSDPIPEKCVASCKEISEPFVAQVISPHYEFNEKGPMPSQSAEWGRMLAAATKRRTEVLTPDNLENMWCKGRHYKNKIPKHVSNAHGFTSNIGIPKQDSVYAEDDIIGRLTKSSKDLNRDLPFEDMTNIGISGNKSGIKRSNSTSALKLPISMEPEQSRGGEGSIISDFYSPYSFVHGDSVMVKGSREVVLRVEALTAHRLNCRVIGAYFEKLGSNSFAVYSIEVTDSENKTWFVKRRYRNFERLHRHLKEIPNYTLHLPPKRIFSSSTEDTFVHQRCIQLHKYLQELLSIANVAEQHEVWDFLSSSSKNYAFGKSSSVIKTLAVSVDDAVDDIFRQLRKVVGPTQCERISIPGRSLPSTVTDMCNYSSRQLPRHNTMDITNSPSENEGESDTVCSQDVTTNSKRTDLDNGWHSDNEISSKSLPPRVIKHGVDRNLSRGQRHHNTSLQNEDDVSSRYPTSHDSHHPYKFEYPVGMPPEWTPPNVSVPLLNLVDKIFQLKRRGWIRRQAFWISKQIIQLVMEDAIDDFLLRQINFVRREDVIADCIRSIRDLLWPDGDTFFMKVEGRETMESGLGSFEARFEASRRANDVKKMIFEGAPAALVSLLGQKQYKRCAEDMYYFLQSTVCIKQLAYGILELLLVSTFPELRQMVADVHEKMAPASN